MARDNKKTVVISRNLFATAIWAIISITDYFIIKIISQSEAALYHYSLLTIINLIIQLIIIKKCKIKLFSFFPIFIVLLYLFHFGQLYTHTLFQDVVFSQVNYIERYMPDYTCTLRTIQVCIISINMIFLGGLLASSFIKKESMVAKIEKSNTCYYFARILFCISFPLKLYIDYKQMTNALTLGYHGAIETQMISGVIGAIASFWYISIPLVYITSKKKSTKKTLLIFAYIYILMTMFTGNRGHQIVNLLGITIIIRYQIKTKMKVKHIILYSIAAFIGLIFIDLIFKNRGYGIIYIVSNFPTLFIASLKNNIVLETINNFGSTILTPYLVISGKGTKFNPFFGETYLKSFVSIVPDAFGAFKNINNDAIFSRNLHTSHNIGGSIIAEFYYNFGAMYPYISVLFGIIYYKVSDKIIKSMNNKNYDAICLYLPFAICTLWWVRDTIGGVIRPVAWLMIIYMATYTITKQVKKEEEQ